MISDIRNPQSAIPPDDALVAAVNRGEARAFDALYYRHRDWVVRLAQRFTGNETDALDVLQETFAYLFRKFPGFRLTASMTTFLYPVVRNLSIAARKKRNRQVLDSDLGEGPGLDAPASAGVDVESGRAELRVLLRELPEGQREVLLMRFVDGMSLVEIGQALSIPEGTVKSRIHNAIQTLKADPRLRAYYEP